MQVRRNKTGSYKLRMQLSRSDRHSTNKLEFGLDTTNKNEAIRRAAICARLVSLVGGVRIPAWKISMPDDESPIDMMDIARAFMESRIVRDDDRPPLLDINAWPEDAPGLDKEG